MGEPLYRHVVPKTFVQLLYDYLEAKGHAPESLLGEPFPEAEPDGIGGVDVERWQRLLERAAERLSDPLVGLHIASTVTSRHLGVLGSVLLASENMGAALQRLERYLRLVFDVMPMIVRYGEGWLEIAWDESDYETGWMVSVTGQAVLIQFCRTLVHDSEASPLHVEFKHEESAHAHAYEDFFGCPVRFGCPEVVVRFSTDLLTKPLKSRDPALLALLEQHANQLLDQLPRQEEVVVQVRKAIAGSLRDGEPDIERISGQLGCSSRTTQRRLKEAGTNFRKELNLVRHELAASYLRDPRLQIVNIAMLLGYSEHSAFTRAFREWTGKTPKEARTEFDVESRQLP